MGAVAGAAQSADAIVVEDFLALPITRSPTGEGNVGSLARVSMMREEPGATGRLFINGSRMKRAIRMAS